LNEDLKNALSSNSPAKMIPKYNMNATIKPSETKIKPEKLEKTEDD
jgi:hypothetical protein